MLNSTLVEHINFVYDGLLSSDNSMTPAGGVHFKISSYGIFAPTRVSLIADTLEYLDFGSEKKLVDLGAGDGRVITMAVLMGGEAIGLEHDPSLVDLAKRAFNQLRQDGLKTPDDSSIVLDNAFAYPIQDADIVWGYMTNDSTQRIVDKFSSEASQGSRLVTYNPPESIDETAKRLKLEQVDVPPIRVFRKA